MEIYTLKLACNTDLIFKEQSMCRINLKNLYGIDPDKELLKQVPSQIKTSLQFGQKTNFEDNSFDVVFVYCVLHHLEKDKIYVGLGSACSAHSKEPSKILTGIGLTDEQARCSLRISFSRNNTVAEIDKFLRAFSENYDKLLPTFTKRTVYK